LKIATWNVNSIRVRLPQVLEWLHTAQVDILGLQEIKLPSEDFPVEAFRELGYQVLVSGQKTYNGVALLGKTPATDVVTDLPGLEDAQRRVLGATLNDIRVINLYVPNGQALDSDKFVYKINWLSKLESWIAREIRTHKKLVVMGDFNIAPEDRDVHDPASWEGSVHVSPQERQALKKLEQLGLRDTFRLFQQPDSSFSWWDYRRGAFRRNAGLRIDLILASQAMADSCLACRTDVEPRSWERPSDHAPVVAHFDF
jgi:exodeoxyribonuclease-3